MKTSTLLVTGASGHLGRLVIENLLKVHSGKIIATTRSPEKLQGAFDPRVEVRAADFDDAASLEKAFAGAERMLLISTDAIGSRIAQHRNAIEAAKESGIKHIVYTSVPHADTAPAAVAPEHWETEKMIKASGLGYTILRNNLYADLLINTLKNSLEAGAMIGTAGEGKTAYVTRADCAKAAAGALASEENANVIVDVTGPEALSYSQIAKIASEIKGKTLPYKDLPEADFKKALVGSGLPENWADVFVSFDLTTRQDLLSEVTGAVKKYGGQNPESLKEFLSKNI